MAPRLQNMASLLKAREALHCVPCPRQQASPVSNCCGGGLELRNAFFTLSGSRAKSIDKRSASGDMQLEVFGSSLSQSFQTIHTVHWRPLTQTWQGLMRRLGILCWRVVTGQGSLRDSLGTPFYPHTEALFFSVAGQEDGAFIRNYEATKSH